MATSNAVPGPSFHQATVKVMSSPMTAEDDSASLFTPTSGAGVAVLVGVEVSVGVDVAVGVRVGVDVFVDVDVAVGVFVGV